jgi:hypothetical protein
MAALSGGARTQLRRDSAAKVFEPTHFQVLADARLAVKVGLLAFHPAFLAETTSIGTPDELPWVLQQ